MNPDLFLPKHKMDFLSEELDVIENNDDMILEPCDLPGLHTPALTFNN